jgi:hypothetical protein
MLGLTSVSPSVPQPRQVGLSCQFIKVTKVDECENIFDCAFLLYQKWLAPELKTAVKASTPVFKRIFFHSLMRLLFFII